MRLSWTFTAVLLGVLGCSGSEATPDVAAGSAMDTSTALATHARANVQRTFMTRNVYFGAELEPVLAARSPEEVPVLVAGAWAQMMANDFPSRAKALAKEIDKSRPEVVGLQEVAVFRRFPQAGGAPAEVDYLALLQAALAARGAHYTVAVVQNDSDVSVPMFAGVDESGAPIIDGVQFVDRDAVLVRDDVPFTQPLAARYVQGLPIVVAGTALEITRGWASVVVDTKQGSFRFMTTHLEDFMDDVQVAQAAELVTVLGSETLPVVLVGDFNSRADGTGTPSYAMIKGTGLVDVWAQAHPRSLGYTCCQPADLSTAGALTERIDFIFTSPSSCHGNGRVRGPVSAHLVGEEARDRIASGLWPSDHAGVVASFVVPFANEH